MRPMYGGRRARNREELKGASIDRASIRRAWRFVRPYRGLLALYLGAILLSSVIGVVPPILFKRLIDTAIPRRDLGMLNVLAGAMVGLAVVSGAISLLNRWLGSRIGEGLIYDLRTALYDHVQRMPIAFFTRTQTGSLMSRLGSDVLDAQRAVGTLASVTSDVLVLVTTLGVMLRLDWQVTLLALMILPSFVVLDRVMSPRFARLARRRMVLNAEMSTTMTERFNVAGAILVKLFGRVDDESREFADRAAKVRDTGITQAVAVTILGTSLTLVGAVGTAAVYWLGARQVIRGSLSIGTVVALAAYIT